MNMTTKEIILNFIKQFRDLGAENTFKNGMCYWFAEILSKRFRGRIIYNQVMNHYATLIQGEIYDITGFLGRMNSDWMLWEDFPDYDPILYRRLQRDCVYKAPDGVRLCVLCEHYQHCGNRVYKCGISNRMKNINDICTEEYKNEC